MTLIDPQDANGRSAGPLTIFAMASNAVEQFLPKPHADGAWASVQYVLPSLVPAWLNEALEDLKHVDEKAREEGYEAIEKIAKQNAKHILESIRLIGLPAPSIYPTEDREVAILFASRKPGSAVLVLCESKGGWACFSSVGGKNRRARADDATDIPHPFLVKELRNLWAAR